MRPTVIVEALVILICVAIAAFFGFACTLLDSCGLDLSLRPADRPAPSPDGVSGPTPVADDRRRAAGPAARKRVTPPGLLAAVPGGLCLLI